MEQKSLGSDMSLTLKLKNPLTEEQLDSLLDVDFDHTNEVFFRTKHGKEVTFVKKQEAIKPYRHYARCGTNHNGMDFWYNCGSCKAEILENDKYCHECGRAVKWGV